MANYHKTSFNELKKGSNTSPCCTLSSDIIEHNRDGFGVNQGGVTGFASLASLPGEVKLGVLEADSSLSESYCLCSLY